MTRVLLVDDDDELRRAIREVLEAAAYEVVEASDGQEALALHRARPADIVLTDVFMPNMDGLELIEALRRLKRDTRVVAFTGSRPRTKDYLLAASATGADRTLAKPFSSQLLVDTLRSLESPGAAH